MLVLTRKDGERIMIGDGIEITIVETKPGSVKLGIVAPPEVTVVRDDARVVN